MSLRHVRSHYGSVSPPIRLLVTVSVYVCTYILAVFTSCALTIWQHLTADLAACKYISVRFISVRLHLQFSHVYVICALTLWQPLRLKLAACKTIRRLYSFASSPKAAIPSNTWRQGVHLYLFISWVISPAYCISRCKQKRTIASSPKAAIPSNTW